ncbi:alpha/beta hydrolase [Sediminibacillus massiliensis]|uniref:alpha/beta hydrolase n=1 Tax=Sediminibacillus massiliensis TaxID=1926277 RepID=UPI0009889124|nr:alpha/beta hydrolase-fold protein [Sediminibacillus massiliensis]
MGRKGKFLEAEINSNFLEEILTVKWYVPETFSDLYKYHICIMQDGDDYFQMGRVATLSDRLHESGEIENTVFAGIHYKDKYDRQDKYHPKGPKQTAYINFLVKEVVPLLDEKLPTYHIGGSRTLMGDSLGGTVSLMAALQYPNTFGQVIMQSPFVDDTVLAAVRESHSLGNLSIYHTIGNQESEVKTTAGEVKDFLSPNRELRTLLDNHRSSYVYHELDGAHTWKYWQKDMKRALITMFN